MIIISVYMPVSVPSLPTPNLLLPFPSTFRLGNLLITISAIHHPTLPCLPQ
nr:MAG TPA: hypothetical protein [Caudoviricetes sp.]